MKITKLDLFEDNNNNAGNDIQEENLSTFEKQQKLIQAQIEQLEEEALEKKKWTLGGESSVKNRPADSLLEEELEFERTSKPVPIITQEVTESIEDMIRRRIKEANFDDIPKRLPMKNSQNLIKNRNQMDVSEYKSSKSLAEIYEEEYGLKKNDDESSNTNITKELEKSHKEIESMYQLLSHKLDALCSAHFIPKPAQKEIDIKVNTSTITMEDAQPLSMSNETTLAPQEIYKPTVGIDSKEVKLKSGLIISKNELSRDDKNRLRRANKRKRSKMLKSKVENKKFKKNDKNDVIQTLKKANVTVIGKKGEKTDVYGEEKKENGPLTSNNLRL
ncbi:rRNA-processing protein MPP10 ASCRUDRAFT_157508 [Ascoidea rubescens DSM 1968]|uniref:Uncharacterized protein n=1 Tax=Ascoidea rubescens DSM 1968 TaxID=1344418 RepID=A0A1D2VEY1_9ASCO|nr:hypothetical protein ASCRUDRAFT_157508 [Ascoidea rubescens DSM 1968]ODV60211.1 hypothetical protein ASCRUDRAFT_157508 [Ascoidea rubescens DSM 1968]